LNAPLTPDVRAIANAVLYEGYVLYPYRPTALKNQKRFNFGVLAPQACCVSTPSGMTWRMQTECIALGHPRTAIEITVRFLHLVTRETHEVSDMRDVTQLHALWQEASEVDVIVPPHLLVEGLSRAQPWELRFACPATRTVETISQPPREEREQHGEFAGRPEREQAAQNDRFASTEYAGTIVRTQQPLEGRIELSTVSLGEQVFKITVRIENTTPIEAIGAGSAGSAGSVGLAGRASGVPSHEAQLPSSMVSTHSILALEGGEFVSSIDPPSVWREAVAACHNIGTWPVLAGSRTRRDLMLSSPIILYDYPEVAPESPGDFFDGAEIDEMLALRILTLTDEEKEQMRHCDDRTRQLFERTEALTPEQLTKLHGAARKLRRGA
jgi:hypothetical protein